MRYKLSWTSALIGIGNRFVLQPFTGDLPGRIKPFHCMFGQFDAQAEAHGTKEPSRCFGRAVHCWNLVLGICQNSTEQGRGLYYYGSLPVGGKKWRNDFPIKSRTGLEKLCAIEIWRYKDCETGARVNAPMQRIQPRTYPWIWNARQPSFHSVFQSVSSTSAFLISATKFSGCRFGGVTVSMSASDAVLIEAVAPRNLTARPSKGWNANE